MSSTECNVCRSECGPPVYRSPAPLSITSICTLLPEPTQVYFCPHCGHVQTPDLQRSDRYYDTGYKILAASEDEDQIYEVRGKQIVYRAQHQLETLLRKVPVAPGAAVLDYGCAKAATTRLLLAQRPDLVPYLFDVSRDYLAFWEKFNAPERCATYSVPAAWDGKMDLVMSYFVLEHANDASAAVARIHALLKPGGQLYFIVPDFLANIGDFVVADHVNHFTPQALRYLLADRGFGGIEIDADAHASAYVVSARKVAGEAPRGGLDPALAARVREIAAYWESFSRRIRDFEAAHASAPAAIYGSGFYGTFVAACLADRSAIECFLDQNPYRWTQRLLDKPIVAPEQLPATVRALYVGLNPARARGEIAKLAPWPRRPLDFFYP